MKKPRMDAMPNINIQIFLHPYLFENTIENMPEHIEIVQPDISVFNNKITRKMATIESMCSGLNEEHIKGSLLTCQMVVFLYSGRTAYGIMGLAEAPSQETTFPLAEAPLNEDGEKLHIELVCTNSTKYAGIGTYLIEVANLIAQKLNKTALTLDAVHRAVEFYNKIGFTRTHETHDDTVLMERAVKNTTLPSLANITKLRRSMRKRGDSKKVKKNITIKR
jgi:hypothetical protein